MKRTDQAPSHILNIFLADDDAEDCLIFNEALQEIPIPSHVTTSCNGEELMRLLGKKTINLPDVLFLDLNMPRKNGFACLEEIKKDERLKQIPVVILSTSFDIQMADLLYQNGAHYYICKPSDYSQVKRVIHSALAFIAEANGKQPSRENFLLSNLKAIL